MLHCDILRERARLTPDRTALVVVPDGDRLTYAQLDARALRCARLWREAGIAPGDRVGILAHNRLEFLDAFFAATKGAGILVTLGTRLTVHELRHVVRDSGMRMLIYDGAFADAVAELREDVQIESWVALDADTRVNNDDLHYASRCAELAASEDETHSATSGTGERWTPPDPESVCCLLYTSGTTGKPKGVMIPHRMLAWNGFNTVACWGLTEDDVSPIFTPLYHAGGLAAFLIPIFTVGGKIVLHRSFDASAIWKTLEAERCSVVLGVPTIWKLLMDAPEFAQVDLGHVRAFYSGGAPLPHYLIEAYQERGVVFKQGFGMTEVGVNCFSMTVEDSVAKAGSIGKPMMNTEVRIVDEEARDCGPDEVGEMWFRGPHVSLGYWNNPEATAAALDAEGWFRSGDLARRDPEGYFYIAGRGKDMFISGGVNVYPAEIEAEMLLHPAIADAAVVGIPDDKWGEVGVAFVVASPGHAAPDAETLSLWLADRLAKFKIPRRFESIPALPRNDYGKVVKGELVKQLKKAK